MCVICVKLAKHDKPSQETLKDMYFSNSDLCGVSYRYPKDNTISTFRGLTIEELLSIDDNIPDDADVVYHFRIATSGTVNVLNSHPFPLYSDLTKRFILSSYSLAHNGVLGSGDKIHSDTYLCVKMIEKLGDLKYTFLDWVSGTNNKIALMTPTGVNLYGNFYKTEDEYSVSKYLVSNEYYKSYYHYKNTTAKNCVHCGTGLYYLSEIKEGVCVWCKKDIAESKTTGTANTSRKIIYLGGSQLFNSKQPKK